MLSCKDISKLASEHVDETLPFTMKMKVKFHLFICRDCKNFINKFKTTINTLGKIEPGAPKNIDLQIQKLMEVTVQLKHEDTEK